MGDDRLIFSYGGNGFDIPCLNNRAKSLGINIKDTFFGPQFDLFQYCKHNLGYDFADTRLKTVERNFLDLECKYDIEGINIPYFYRNFVIERNYGALIPIIDHNFQDVMNLVRIFGMVSK